MLGSHAKNAGHTKGLCCTSYVSLTQYTSQLGDYCQEKYWLAFNTHNENDIELFLIEIKPDMLWLSHLWSNCKSKFQEAAGMTTWKMKNLIRRCNERQKGWGHTEFSGSGILSPVYSTRTCPSSLRARYSTQNGPWCLRGSFEGRLCLLSTAGTRMPTCHFAL
jgi:hypothetical protein